MSLRSQLCRWLSCHPLPETKATKQRIVVVNRSDLPDDQVADMTGACAEQIHRDVAPVWRIAMPSVRFSTRPVEVEPAGAWVLAMLNDIKQGNALGWHTATDGERVFGVVSVAACREAGFPVPAVLSHEVIEAAIGTWVNRFASDHAGTLWALEPADPVQAHTYKIDGVAMSNWVTPDWFNPYGLGPFDHLGVTSRPFEIAEGGYAVTMDATGRTHRYGADFLRDAKGGQMSRGDRIR